MKCKFCNSEMRLDDVDYNLKETKIIIGNVIIVMRQHLKK